MTPIISSFLKRFSVAIVLAVSVLLPHEGVNAAITASEIIKLDQVGRAVSAGVTNDSNRYVYNIRVDPTTGALIFIGTDSDNATNSTTKVPVIVARANASAPSWTEGKEVPLSVDLAGNARFNMVQVGGTNISLGQAAMASSIPVVISSNQSTVNVALANDEVNLSASTAPSKMIAIGAQYNSSAPTPSNGQTVVLQLDSSGNLKMNCIAGCSSSSTQTDATSFTYASGAETTIGAVYNATITNLSSGQQGAIYMSKNRTLAAMPFENGQQASLKTAVVAISTATNTQIVAAVASKRIKVLHYTISQEGSVPQAVQFTDGSGGTKLCSAQMAASANPYGVATQYPSFIFATTAGNALYVTTTSMDAIEVSVTYWSDDGN